MMKTDTSLNYSATYMPDRNLAPLPQFKILGQPVHLGTDYARWLCDRLQQGIGSKVVTMNAEIVMLANQNPELADCIEKADLVTPDGAGVSIALQLYGIEQSRCAGIDLGEDLMRLAVKPEYNHSVFFYGGRPEIVTKAVQRWQTELPDLQIAGVAHGYLNEAERAELLDRLVATQPKIIFAALGMGRQEAWIRDNFHLCPQAIWVGVGGSFDVWSGTKNRAPEYIRNLNLEWIYRIAQEPSRWRRALALPQFAVLALAERLGLGIRG